MSIDNKVVSSKSERIGLRSVRLVQEPDEHGRSFYFEVNGIPFFAKGANYIPGEIFISQQDNEYYEKLFDNIEAANMNFVRVWGGGIYENDEFYRQADERGILVWQDFIFGCVPYPSDDWFLANVKEEIVYNIKGCATGLPWPSGAATTRWRKDFSTGAGRNSTQLRSTRAG